MMGLTLLDNLKIPGGKALTDVNSEREYLGEDLTFAKGTITGDLNCMCLFNIGKCWVSVIIFMV